MNLAGLIAVSSLVALSSASACAESRFNIALAEDGRYRVKYEQIPGIGGSLPSAELYLYEQGRRVPLEVNDGGDAVFGPGDSIQFIGRRLAGENSWYDEYSLYNIYQLHVGVKGRNPGRVEAATAEGGVILEHIEQDKLRVALPHAERPELAERWYWQRITHLAGDHFSQQLNWSEVPVALRVALTGLSYDQHAIAAGLPQHRVVIYLDGKPAGEAAWDGQESTTISITLSDLEYLGDSGALLEVRVPGRLIPGTDRQLVDAILVNWIELEFPPEAELPNSISDRGGNRRLKVAPGWLPPSRVEQAPDREGLATANRQADYLMISHPGLMLALAPLAQFHRAQGLAVEVVDIHSVFDEFSHGVATPQAIQSFISHAWNNWRRPAPAMVLLVGDASWGREPGSAVSRNLVPTFQVLVEGHLAASDNGLVSVTGDDWRPDLAVGRLPAGDAAELTTMIEKLLQHAAHPPQGDWRQRTAWVSGSESQFQDISSTVSALATARGLSAELIFPENLSASGGQSKVIEAFNQGSALVHFLGHGGRFVWRTGPPDLRDATDLFSTDTIASLEMNHPLPMVLSMTCSSGPFDHPTADSLAESFLLAPGRGAMGVLAASWRVPSSQRFSTLLVESLLQPGKPIGVAIMEAKQRERRRSLVESYNLLGDPALSIIPGALR